MSAPIIDSLPLPPHSPEAEHALLGALLANPESFHLIEPPLEPGDFYNYANRLIYQAIFSLASQGKPADVLTVSDLLREIGNEKETGGLEYFGTHQIPLIVSSLLTSSSTISISGPVGSIGTLIISMPKYSVMAKCLS